MQFLTKFTLLSLTPALFISCDTDLRSRRDVTKEKEEKSAADEERETLERKLAATKGALDSYREEKKMTELEKKIERRLKFEMARNKSESDAKDDATKAQSEDEVAEKEAQLLEEQNKKAEEEAKLAEERAKIAEEEAKRFQIIENKRQKACLAFIGTEFAELVLKDGTTYKKLKVTKADALGVTFRYEHGMKRIEYPILPDEIAQKCLYDPLAAERRIKMEQDLAASRAEYIAKIKEIAAEKEQNKLDLKIKKAELEQTSEKAFVPRGYLSCKVIAFRHSSSSKKTVQISAYANVNAYVYMNGSQAGSILAKKKTTLTADSYSSGNYEVTLKDANGNLLDRETESRKTGLGL